MTITPLFHDALIHSIVEMTKENDDISIFEFIQLMISETNGILSPGARDFGPSLISKTVKRYIQGIHSYPLISEHYGFPKEKKKILYRDCLVKIHEAMYAQLDVSWYDLLTYLLFIQSNCHHKGDSNSHKLCRNSDSFLDFFYKSKSAFNPWLRWEESDRLRYGRDIEDIPKTKAAELRGEWWVKAFEREKDILLMFETLAPSHYLGKRLTTGWVVRGLKAEEGDILPYGSVLNQLREHYGLPALSGDYGLGTMSVKDRVIKGVNNNDKGIDDEKCVYFNIGLCIGIGLVNMFRFINAKVDK